MAYTAVRGKPLVPGARTIKWTMAPKTQTRRSSKQRTSLTEPSVDLPTQTPFEVALELQDYERSDVERLYRAVWPDRGVMESRSDLNSETAANMAPEVRAAFTNGGIDAAVEAANEWRANK